ncbi:MAG: hypothetical protein OXN83_04490 [Oligoflexia bacterium]|nr:hypothetical protein [Oligoflexia bacterium]
MFFKNPFDKKEKKNFIVLTLQILFLIFSLLLVLWGQKKLRTKGFIQQTPSLERKAQFIVPSAD